MICTLYINTFGQLEVNSNEECELYLSYTHTPRLKFHILTPAETSSRSCVSDMLL